MQTEPTVPNIFQALQTAVAVGGLSTSMQSPNLDEDVLTRALVGEADPSDVVLSLWGSGEENDITVGELLAAIPIDDTTWKLSERETLWIIPKPAA